MNKIITSYFRPNNLVATEIENISPRVFALMKNISENFYDFNNGERRRFEHRDLGTKENMEKLFSDLEAA